MHRGEGGRMSRDGAVEEVLGGLLVRDYSEDSPQLRERDGIRARPFVARAASGTSNLS